MYEENKYNEQRLCRIFSATCMGLEVITITIEVSILNGVGIFLVGLPDSAVRESLLRVTTALQAGEFHIPGRKIVINLAPANIKKEGSSYDAAIAIGLLCASNQVRSEKLAEFLIMGELSLDGQVRAIPGALPIAIDAKEKGYKYCILPSQSAKEAADVDGIIIYRADSLREIIDIIEEKEYTSSLIVNSDIEEQATKYDADCDFAYVMGQEYVKRGLEIAAAGNHNLMMIGPPGSGKSFMARCLSSILPPMSREEALETSKIYSVAGKSSGLHGLMRTRPFRTPHHTASMVSLVGGGANALPGEISLAHNGVLYLDEMAEYPASTLNILRQPLEDRKISISRARYKVDYPASFMLVGSMNPCPCGYAGESSNKCNCGPAIINRYMSKISGPLTDRIDINIRVKRVESEKLISREKAESSADIAKRVLKAREVQLQRFQHDNCYSNSQMSTEQLSRYCSLGAEELLYINKILDKFELSARSYSRIIKISRTIADLEGSRDIALKHLLEATQFRFP